MKNNPWTIEETEFLHDNANNLTAKEISIILKRTENSISVKRRRIGIKLSHESLSKLAKEARNHVDNNKFFKLDHSIELDSLSNMEYQVLIGCLLGDGCVKRQTKNHFDNFVFYCGHAEKQRAYLIWKANVLSIFKPFFSSIRISKNIKRQNFYDFSTPSHPIFKKLRNDFYTKEVFGTKDKLPPEYINRLNYLGLLIWYLDDGHFDKGNISIAVKGYGIEILKNACIIINKNLNLHTYIRTSKWNDSYNWILVLPKIDRDILLPIWESIFEEYKIPDCMLYKIKLKKTELKFNTFGAKK